MTESIDPNRFYQGGLAVASYDAFYEDALPKGPVAGDVDFYIARAREEGGSVLELGVGTARVAIPLAEAGFTVTGVDLSPAMLAVARTRIAQRSAEIGARIKLVNAGMDDFALAEHFDLAIIPFRAFHHVIEAHAQRRTLETIHAHLRPGGLLIIDIFDADLSTVVPGGASPALPREIADPRTGGCIRRTTIERVNDPFAQTICEHVRIEAFDAAGALIASEDTSFSFRWTTHNEMACMLELAGFTVEALYGDFKGGPPGYKREQIWLARKPA